MNIVYTYYLLNFLYCLRLVIVIQRKKYFRNIYYKIWSIVKLNAHLLSLVLQIKHRVVEIKKQGLPYQVGRDSWSSIAMHGTSQKLSMLQMPLTTTVRQSRPIGSRIN